MNDSVGCQLELDQDTPYYHAFVAFEPMISVIGSFSCLHIENVLISVSFSDQVDI